MVIKKVIVPAAGLGTRLLPVTKELPKEMLPVPFKGKNGRVCLKPLLQAIFEQLFDVGFREFGFVVGRGKRAIEDHFTTDLGFVEYLKKRNKTSLAGEMQEFYDKVNDSTILFVNQPKPKGFGDAVYNARAFTQNEPFCVHAGDNFVISRGNLHLKRMIEIFEDRGADAVFLAERVEDPRGYGVMVGKEIEPDVFRVTKVIEKPKKPPSNFAIIALYIFTPIIYEAIQKVKLDESGEIQLTDAIQLLLNWQREIFALKLRPNERRIDIGVPDTYLKTIRGVLHRQS